MLQSRFEIKLRLSAPCREHINCPVKISAKGVLMIKRTEVLQEVQKMRFTETYEGWQKGRLKQEEAASLLGVCDRTFRRYLVRYE